MELLLFMVIAVALTFDFTNGFHDTANSIATMVGTRALDPQHAVIFAAVLNFVGAFLGGEVAATVGKGIIDPTFVTLELLLAALVGAISWNLATWYFGIPSSSSHALIGGLIGAGLAAHGSVAVLWSGVVEKVAIPSVLAPTLGFVGAMVLMGVLMRMFRNSRPGPANRGFRMAQIVSGGWLSLNHGRNDAQKAMGIMAIAIITVNGGDPDAFDVPMWVTFAAASAMGLGTYAGGWRIIKTLGGKMVKMKPVQGFAASVAAATILEVTARVGVPVSTTHCVTGCVMGAGASKRISSVRWGVVGDIVTAWVLTLPAAAAVGAVAYAMAAASTALLMAIFAVGLVLLRLRSQQRPVPVH